jgi:hypothetical protein
VLGRLDDAPCFVDPTGRQQSPCNFGGDLRHSPDPFLVLSNERVDIALGIRDFLQRQPDGADA